MELLEFVLSTTYFQFKCESYRQVFSAPIGSPVSVAVADLYMVYHEQTSMDTATLEMRSKVWKRYIDDSFEIVKKDQRDNFTAHMNSIDQTGIRFMDETEVDGSIAFPDALVMRKDDGTMKVRVYHKKTHTDQYLNFTSHHPIQHHI